MKTDYVQLGKNIKKYRNKAGLTQSQLAESIDCSDSHIGQIENAHSIPSFATVEAIADVLDVTIDRLRNGDRVNSTDYFIQEMVTLTSNFSGKDKLMAMELIKANIQVLKEFKT